MFSGAVKCETNMNENTKPINNKISLLKIILMITSKTQKMSKGSAVVKMVGLETKKKKNYKIQLKCFPYCSKLALCTGTGGC